MKGNVKCTSGNLLSLLEAQKKDLGAANTIIIYKFTIGPFNIIINDQKHFRVCFAGITNPG